MLNKMPEFVPTQKYEKHSFYELYSSSAINAYAANKKHYRKT